MRDTIEDDLISNKLPYPKYYDGQSWNTITLPYRKTLPTYLKKGLPEKKFQQIKQKFQQMDKFSPPEITYFQKMIKPPRKSQTKRNRSYRQQSTINKRKELQQVREEIKYALIMSDRKSNILVNLLEKAVSLEKNIQPYFSIHQETFQKKLIRGKKTQSLKLGHQTHECFRNTMDLVFSLKKKQCTDRMKQYNTVELRPETANKINSIRLLTYDDQKIQ